MYFVHLSEYVEQMPDEVYIEWLRDCDAFRLPGSVAISGDVMWIEGAGWQPITTCFTVSGENYIKEITYDESET